MIKEFEVPNNYEHASQEQKWNMEDNDAKPYILCVDDEKMILNSLRQELRNAFKEEFAIETASSGQEAMEIVEELEAEGKELTLVIADYLMPGLKGDELLVHIHATLPETRTIMLTGQATLEGVANAVNRANLFRYIGKPWEATDLELTVREAMRSYRQDRQIRQHNRELEILNKKLSKLNDSKNYFLGLMAHELTTPINTIVGFANVLFDHAENEIVKDSASALLKAAVGLRHFSEMALLIINLLSERHTFRFTHIDALQLVHETIFFCERKASRKNVQLRLDKDSGSVQLFVDQQLIIRALIIIVENAIKYSPTGSTVQINCGLKKGGFSIAVSDSGAGFSKESLENIFELFSADELLHHTQGYGLGLATASIIMQRHNGAIDARNVAGSGAQVELLFPLQPSF